MKKFTCLSLCLAVSAGVWLTPTTTLAGAVSLDSAVPEGVYIFVHGKHNDERAFLDKHWARVWDELKKTNIHQEIQKLLLSKAPPEEAETARQQMNQVFNLIGAVDWAGLFKQETVFAGRMMVPVPEYVFLTRPTSDSYESNVSALHAIFSAAENAQPGVTIEKSELDGGAMWTLMWTGIPVQASMFNVNGVIGFGIGDGLVSNAIDTLSGKKAGKPLVQSARFKAAFDGLPAAEDERVFFDMSTMVDGLDTMVKGMVPPAEEGQPAPQGAEWMKFTRACFGEMRMLDYTATVAYTDGLRTYQVSKAALAKDAKEKLFYKALGKPDPIKKFNEYVPQSATSFSVSSGFNIGGFYDALVAFTKANVPGGEGYLAEWSAVQDQMGFNLQNDLLSWLGSGCISVSMPAASPMAMGMGDWVMMVDVTDATSADEHITTWLNQLNTFSQQQGQPITPTPTSIAGDDKFMTITYAPIAMFFRPVIGVHGGHLVIASSSGAIETVLSTAGGEAPSILENARFKAEGIRPDGPVQSVSFQDLRGSYKGLAMAMGMAGGMGAMFTASMPPEQGQAVQAFLGIVAKLAPVIAAMDFYESTASMTTFDGQTYKTKTVTTYQPFKEAPPAATSAGAETP